MTDSDNIDKIKASMAADRAAIDADTAYTRHMKRLAEAEAERQRRAAAMAKAEAEAEAERLQRQRDTMDIINAYNTVGAVQVATDHLWHATSDVLDGDRRRDLFEFLKASKAAWLDA